MAVAPQILALSNPAHLAADLLAWFDRVKRDLPWRTSDDLYGIWVSEIMLQQTTVQAVIPFWERFMARFPTVAALAAAAEPEVLELWSGLGYYTRARNLHAAAQTICNERGGRLPGTRDDWLTLPGVGPYAAGAIASIGLSEAVAALDANARRVLQRWAVTDPTALAKLTAGQRQRLIDTLGADLVPTDNPGTWNEALMELGALVCGARRAQCQDCPVRSHCNAWAGDWVAAVPPPRKAAASEPVWVGQLLVTWRDRVLLVPPGTPAFAGDWGDRAVARADFRGLHQGLWGLPMTPWLAGQADPELPATSWRDWLALPAAVCRPKQQIEVVGHFRHAITKFRLRVAVLHLRLDSRQEMPAARLGMGRKTGPMSPAKPGLFFATKTIHPPVSKLTEKSLHFQLDTAV